MFLSMNRLTAYNNGAQPEVYVYKAESRSLACVSCNPSGALAAAPASLTEGNSVSGPRVPSPFETHNLSENGSRVFFQTPEALLPEDSNGVTDVYEWERPGSGTCETASARFLASAAGCIYLISTGQGSSTAYFGDASPSGDDAYFFTRQQLVGQDIDNNADVYDAKEHGGLAFQNPVSPISCESEASCRSGWAPPVSLESPASTAPANVGNVAPSGVVTTKATAGLGKQTSRAQKLSKALKACRRQRKTAARRLCVKRAQQRYGSKTKATRKAKNAGLGGSR